MFIVTIFSTISPRLINQSKKLTYFNVIFALENKDKKSEHGASKWIWFICYSKVWYWKCIKLDCELLILPNISSTMLEQADIQWILVDLFAI